MACAKAASSAKRGSVHDQGLRGIHLNPRSLDRNEGLAMSTRRDFRAMTREAVQAVPGAALILGGLLLLTAP